MSVPIGIPHPCPSPGGAIEAFDSIPLHHQYYPEARAQIASIHERRGDYKLALQEVQQAQALRPSRELDLEIDA